MEVVDDHAAMLSNFEVYELLRELQENQRSNKKSNKSQQPLATILYSTLKHLEKTPCVDQDSEVIATFMQLVAPFKLTKAEKLQLLNLRPTTAVEIQLIIEESEERLTEEQIGQLLEIITTTLPGDPSAAGADEEEEERMEEDTSVGEAS